MSKKHKPIYLNWKGPQGNETVDEFTRGEDAPEDVREFRRYVREMQAEHSLAGMSTYQSSRPCKGWND